MNYPNPLSRLAAFAIDLVVLIGIYMVIGLVANLALVLQTFLKLPMVGFWFYGGLITVGWLYFAFCESSSWQATVGKKLLGLKVTTLTGEKASFWRVSIRHFCKFFSRILCMVGFLMVFWTKKRQALHDKMARVLVVKSS